MNPSRWALLCRWGGVWLSLSLAACSTPSTRVVLLPQAQGQGAVDVRPAVGAAEVVHLQRAFEAVEVGAQGRMQAQSVNPLKLRDRYGPLLNHLPPPAQTFTLYFETGGAELTAESRAEIERIVAATQARAGGEVVVIGHTDRVGALQANDALSLARAQKLRELFIAQGVSAARVDAQGRGEREPAIATADEVAEPRNRRAEIWVR